MYFYELWFVAGYVGVTHPQIDGCVLILNSSFIKKIS